MLLPPPQWGGALRDATKNGCAADYQLSGLSSFGLKDGRLRTTLNDLMGVHDHMREMKHTEHTLVFPSPPVQTLSGECFSTMISGVVWVNDWLKVVVTCFHPPN